MAFLYGDRVKDVSTTTGTGNLTLSGTAPTGFQSFDAVFGHAGNTFYYVIDDGAGNWEVGSGHLSASTTLVRDTVITSSNSNAAVSFGAGTKTVFADLPAQGIARITTRGQTVATAIRADMV